MISYVKGILVEMWDDTVVVEAGSIGFNVHVPLSVLEELPKIGTEIILYTYFQVREDAMSLYGFLNRQDLGMFKQLIGVNGIGPKAALSVLSAIRPDDLRMAIIQGDAKAISKAPGIGTKTAQRVILDLKDKIHMEDIISNGFVHEEEVERVSSGAAGEAVDALVALGYSVSEASRAVGRVEVTESMTSEDVLKASLRHLSFL